MSAKELAKLAQVSHGRTPAVIPGAAPPRPRLGRGRRIWYNGYRMRICGI